MNLTPPLASLSRSGLALSVALSAGCYGSPEPTGSAPAAIQDGTFASDFQSQRAVLVSTNFLLSSASCTGTIISPRHVLTAAHCLPSVRRTIPGNLTLGTQVFFFGTSIQPNLNAPINVTAVALPSGVNAADGDLTDSNGKFADYAVLTLASNVPASSMVATLAHVYPGANVWGALVGRGNHENGNGAPINTLLQASNRTESGDDNDGSFHNVWDRTDRGDSGGPFYVNARQVGVLTGDINAPFDPDNLYSSVPFHLSRILDMMGFTTSLTTTPNTYLVGGDLEVFFTSDRDVCAYACQNNSACQAFTHVPLVTFGECHLKSSASGTRIAFSGATSGTR